MKHDTRVPSKHQLDHTVPTVIHHPEEDLPLLARWLHRAMANQTRFWSLVAGLVVVVIGLAVLSTGFSLGRSTSDEAWTRLELAKTPAERVEIARQFPNTQAERWALLQAATEFYYQGFNDLPSNRDVAGPNLKKALDLFEQVARAAPQDSPQARAAALGVARTLEARNELDKAIAQYERVAKTWPGTDEAEQAQQLAAALRRPEAAAFYRELYAYSPPEMTLPPRGQGTLNLPSTAPSSSSSPGATTPAPFSLPPPPSPTPSSPPSGLPAPPDTAQPPVQGLPLDLPTPPASPTPKAETPKAELPGDPFAPETKGGTTSP